MSEATATASELELIRVDSAPDLPGWLDLEALTEFLHESLKPYEDSVEDVRRGLEYALSNERGKGGFVILGVLENRLVGALTMLETGMAGYIPENLLLFVAVAPEMRGRGLGRRIVEDALARCDGAVKLHVEYDNPAKRLYERIGFTSKYAEMRYSA